MYQVEEDSPFCCKCREDFPVSKDISWRMGEMRHLSKAPKYMRDQLKDWENHPTGRYLCGSCYYDLEDEHLR